MKAEDAIKLANEIEDRPPEHYVEMRILRCFIDRSSSHVVNGLLGELLDTANAWRTRASKDAEDAGWYKYHLCNAATMAKIVSLSRHAAVEKTKEAAA